MPVRLKSLTVASVCAVPSVTRLTPWRRQRRQGAGTNPHWLSCKPSKWLSLGCTSQVGQKVLLDIGRKETSKRKSVVSCSLDRGTADQKNGHSRSIKVRNWGDRGSQRTGLLPALRHSHPHVPRRVTVTRKPDTAATRICRQRGIQAAAGARIALELDLSGICLCAGDKTNLVYRPAGCLWRLPAGSLSYAPGEASGTCGLSSRAAKLALRK